MKKVIKSLYIENMIGETFFLLFKNIEILFITIRMNFSYYL